MCNMISIKHTTQISKTSLPLFHLVALEYLGSHRLDGNTFMSTQLLNIYVHKHTLTEKD